MNNQNQDRIVRGCDVDSITAAPLQLVQHAYLGASNEEVFEVVSNHATLHKFTKTITHIDIDNSVSIVQNTCDVGTLRYCHTPLRMIINEKIVWWEFPFIYGYQILNFQTILPDHLGLVLTEPTVDGHTLLTWRTYFGGKMISERFARISLGIILPDLVGNITKHFGGRAVSASEANSLLLSSDPVTG